MRLKSADISKFVLFFKNFPSFRQDSSRLSFSKHIVSGETNVVRCILTFQISPVIY